jgi:hypothetical protein
LGVLKFQIDVNSEKLKRSILKWHEIFYNGKKFRIVEWFQRRMSWNIEEVSQRLFAPWEMRKSTIWKFSNLQAKRRGVWNIIWNSEIRWNILKLEEG